MRKRESTHTQRNIYHFLVFLFSFIFTKTENCIKIFFSAFALFLESKKEKKEKSKKGDTKDLESDSAKSKVSVNNKISSQEDSSPKAKKKLGILKRLSGKKSKSDRKSSKYGSSDSGGSADLASLGSESTASADVSATTTEVSTTSAEMSTTITEEPTTSAEVSTTITEVPATSAEVKESSEVAKSQSNNNASNEIEGGEALVMEKSSNLKIVSEVHEPADLTEDNQIEKTGKEQAIDDHSSPKQDRVIMSDKLQSVSFQEQTLVTTEVKTFSFKLQSPVSSSKANMEEKVEEEEHNKEGINKKENAQLVIDEATHEKKADQVVKEPTTSAEVSTTITEVPATSTEVKESSEVAKSQSNNNASNEIEGGEALVMEKSSNLKIVNEVHEPDLTEDNQIEKTGKEQAIDDHSSPKQDRVIMSDKLQSVSFQEQTPVGSEVQTVSFKLQSPVSSSEANMEEKVEEEEHNKEGENKKENAQLVIDETTHEKKADQVVKEPTTSAEVSTTITEVPATSAEVKESSEVAKSQSNNNASNEIEGGEALVMEKSSNLKIVSEVHEPDLTEDNQIEKTGKEQAIDDHSSPKQDRVIRSEKLKSVSFQEQSPVSSSEANMEEKVEEEEHSEEVENKKENAQLVIDEATHEKKADQVVAPESGRKYEVSLEDIKTEQADRKIKSSEADSLSARRVGEVNEDEDTEIAIRSKLVVDEPVTATPPESKVQLQDGLQELPPIDEDAKGNRVEHIVQDDPRITKEGREDLFESEMTVQKEPVKKPKTKSCCFPFLFSARYY